MDDWPSLIFKIALLFVLILVNAFFAMSEIAIISLSDTKMKKMAEDGHKGAKKVLQLTESPSAFLSTIQIGVTLAGFLTSASAADSFAEPLSNWIIKIFSLSQNLSGIIESVALILVTIVISYFSLVLGELAPKRIGTQCAEKIAFKVIGILLFIKKVMAPFIKILSFSTNTVVRLLGFNPNANDEEVTEEEILMMVDAGEEKGVIEESQKEMINNIFEFDDLIARDVMTHRIDITAMAITENYQELIEKVINAGCSRVPVYDGDLDDIKGVLYVKDLLQYVGKTIPKTLTIDKLMREAIFVPETKRCGDLFTEMTEKHIHMVFVSDEYGAVVGIVTIEDLIEAIVGNIQDEYDHEEEEIEQINDNTYTLDGITNISEVEELLDVVFPEGEYDTIGGFILSELGRIPNENEYPEIVYENCRFTINEVDERRIKTIIVEKLSTNEANIIES